MSDTGSGAEGIVYLVGAGPGDPGLMTARGQELIGRADAIVFDSAISRSLIPADARETGHPVLYFVGKSRGGSAVPRREVEELLVRLAREGKRVVRLSGGDPFVFGRGADEAQALHDASVPFEVVPGVTAGIAAISYAGIPVTHPGMGASVTFVSGKEIPGRSTTQTDWSSLAKAGGTIVIYSGIKSIGSIAQALIDGGMPEEIPAAIVERGTRKSQRTVTATLGTLVETVRVSRLRGAAITIIGWPVILRDEMSWFENRELFGKRMIVADSGHVGTAAAGLLRELGAEVFQMPAESVARLDLTAMRSAIATLADFQWIIFTSRNAVTVFWEQLLASGRDARALAGIAIAAAGAETAGALLEHGIAVDIIPDRFTADSLLDKLRERDDVSGARLLYVSPEGADSELAADIAELGAEVTALDAYRGFTDTRIVERLRRALDRKLVDMVVFTSPASVRGFVAAAGGDLSGVVRAASISDGVSDALVEAGIDVTCEAERPTAASLAAAVEQAFK